MIKVSAIIPTYKRPQETARCLKLLGESQFLNERFYLETVVVDSSPDDLTWQAIKPLVKDLNLNYSHLKKQTPPGQARNLAVEKATSELIISVDSDIEFQKETLWRIINFFKNHPTIARMTGKSIFLSGGKQGQTDRPTKWDRMFKENDTTFIEGIYGRYEAFYKSAFQKIGGYDPIFEFSGEGTDISVRFWRAGFPLGFGKDIIAYHNAEAPESLRRHDPIRMARMYRALFLVAYKYDLQDPEFSPNFIKTFEERQTAYGQATEFHAIISAAHSIDWFKKNYQEIVESKKKIPHDFDFKPFDIFTDKKLLDVCLSQAKEKIVPYYKRIFEK